MRPLPYPVAVAGYHNARCWCRLNVLFGQILLKLLGWERHCKVLLAGGYAVCLVQQLAALLDCYIAQEGAEKGPCKDSAMLDMLLQVPCNDLLSVQSQCHQQQTGKL